MIYVILAMAALWMLAGFAWLKDGSAARHNTDAILLASRDIEITSSQRETVRV